MKKQQIISDYTLYNNSSELEQSDAELLKLALKAQKNAYAPYSNFKVGAAIRLDNGITVVGNNQENAAYPSGLCAERVAIFNAGSNYPDNKILKIAIVANSSTKNVDRPVAPCGACRQVISEYETKQKSAISIFFMGGSGAVVKINSIEALLPFSFNKTFL